MSAAEDARTALTRPGRRLDPALLAWIVVAVVAVACFTMRDEIRWLKTYPKDWVIPFDQWMNLGMDWFVDRFKWLFRAISWTLDWPMTGIRDTLHWLPWPATIVIFCAMAHAASGWRLSLFTFVSLLYMVIVGYWDESMNTLALVVISVPLAVAAGLFMGIWGFKSQAARRVIDPMLDIMQTVPTFAYLIPILLLFGFGPVVGLVASVIYAIPPMVRNTLLGLSLVPQEIVESGRMSGCTDRQLLWWVEVPAAAKNIMMGVNQTIMAALSMVIIAAIIGGFDDIGWVVLSTMRKAQFGPSLVSGLVIALLAMVIDRISMEYSKRDILTRRQREGGYVRHRHLIAGGVALGVILPLSVLLTPLRQYPDAWTLPLGPYLNSAVDSLVVNYSDVMDAIKETALFYFMLPLRIGYERAISPYSWGFELTPAMSIGYAIGIATLGLFALRKLGARYALAVVIFGTLAYFGTTGTPWPVFIAVVTMVAWRAGGIRVASIALFSMTFILLNGLWQKAMLSVYLCGAAVFLSFVAGTALGVWASQNDHVSRILRPINDTLQTMPQFVFLIPALMLFQVGEFSALLAIIAYAIVPSIRYSEHGIRRIPEEVLEAARSMGCTRWQFLWHVKLPLAIPEIMLGLNQTILYGLAMLVIAALVGTQGLGQQVYIALGKADSGLGLVAGLSIALVAITADRIIQAWSQDRKAALGL